ncbi:Hypothetical predicted protein, partial [Pelobates cultripes]
KASGVPVPKENGDSTSASSEEQTLDELDEFPNTGEPHHFSSDEDNKLPSTKGDIKAPLCNIQTMFVADIAAARE